MPRSAKSVDAGDQKSSRSTQIIIALIGFAATVLVGYWQFGRSKPDNSSAKRQITGRVVDAATNHTLAHAKVVLESEDLPPVQYTDSEGIFTFPLPPSAPYVRVKVELSGYEPADRRIDPSALRETQEIRLQPMEAPSTPPAQAGPAARDEASRDFVIGRWQVDQAAGQVSGGTVVDYKDDGTWTGSVTQFINGYGRKVSSEGRWNFEKLSKDTFRMELQLQNQQILPATFKIMDHNHIHNIDQNYIAVRVE